MSLYFRPTNISYFSERYSTRNSLGKRVLQPLEQAAVENLQSYLFSRAIVVSRVYCGLIARRHQLLKSKRG